MELQFLDHHKKQYLELSSNFASISFIPKSRTALENMKELILLDLKINIPKNNQMPNLLWQHLF